MVKKKYHRIKYINYYYPKKRKAVNISNSPKFQILIGTNHQIPKIIILLSVLEEHESIVKMDNYCFFLGEQIKYYFWKEQLKY